MMQPQGRILSSRWGTACLPLHCLLSMQCCSTAFEASLSCMEAGNAQ